MKRTGVSDLPLHGGRAPPWLFRRMVKLAGGITGVIVDEYSQEEFLRRLSDPFWFQAFGCVLGFDWHSSGLTTTVTGSLKEALKAEEPVLIVCGGKGKTSRKTPAEIEKHSEAFNLSTKKIETLKRSSRMSAKVDNTALQDGYNLYHHAFVFTEKGSWSVIQQGMNPANRYARRYHWLSDNVKSFVEEPHNAICCNKTEEEALNMVSKRSEDTRKISVDLVKEDPLKLQKYFGRQTLLQQFIGNKPEYLRMPRSHYIINMSKRNLETLKKAGEFRPENYEEFLAIKGIGPKSVRALALISELIYGKPPSWKDPVKFSFSHGGKDGVPYPVERETMDKSIGVLKTGIEGAKLGNKEKLNAIRRLNWFVRMQ
jgi:hypothetical protein